ncbi:Oligopeptide transport system permease protein OppB [Clostridiaceae bacterium JG1575]|nr:Oligopeptide transport system permease protein OppB [Clostridiaceae bacterium JG1575]
MTKYILKRLLMSLLTVWIIITLVFFLMRLMPGSPFTSERFVPPQVLENMKAQFGLDKSWGEQYLIYMKGLLQGNMGPMLKKPGYQVSEYIWYLFPASAKIGAVAVVFSLVVGMFLGIVAAFNQGKLIDRIVMIIATIGISIPGFVLASLLLLLLGVKLDLLPVMGLTSWKHYIMPTLALSGYPVAFIARLTRSRLLDVIRSDYIRTARAKGLKENKVIWKHALRNTLIPVITYLGPLVAGVLTGSFAIEGIFSIPGMGREFVVAISQRDYTMLQGVIIFYALLLIFLNFLTDILYVVIDPRIKIDGSEA